jgi:hypothetical protein
LVRFFDTSNLESCRQTSILCLASSIETLLEGGFRCAVQDFLVEARAISEALRSRMLAWRYGGFSAHNQVRVAAGDRKAA